MEDLSNNETTYPQNGKALFLPNDKLSSILDDNLEFLTGPEVDFGSIGLAGIELSKEVGGSDHELTMVLSGGQLIIMKRSDAENKGFYDIGIKVKNATLPEGYSLRCNAWSPDDKLLVSSVALKESDPVEVKPHVNYNFFKWTNMLEGDENKELFLHIQNDPSLLQRLRFNFETIDANPKGGETQN